MKRIKCLLDIETHQKYTKMETIKEMLLSNIEYMIVYEEESLSSKLLKYIVLTSDVQGETMLLKNNETIIIPTESENNNDNSQNN